MKKNLANFAGDVAYYAALVFIIYVMVSDIPFTLRFWYYTMKICHNLAYGIGRIGLHAEQSYIRVKEITYG